VGDTVSEFEEFLNWRKGQESSKRQEGILGEIRDHLKSLSDALKQPGEGDGGEGDGGEDGTPPPPPKDRAGSGGEGGGSTKRPSRWFGEATG
jgi:hypothetical protein